MRIAGRSLNATVVLVDFCWISVSAPPTVPILQTNHELIKVLVRSNVTAGGFFTFGGRTSVFGG